MFEVLLYVILCLNLVDQVDLVLGLKFADQVGIPVELVVFFKLGLVDLVVGIVLDVLPLPVEDVLDLDSGTGMTFLTDLIFLSSIIYLFVRVMTSSGCVPCSRIKKDQSRG
jgi:hypothetical protein